jgi:hypothetical protein
MCKLSSKTKRANENRFSFSDKQIGHPVILTSEQKSQEQVPEEDFLENLTHFVKTKVLPRLSFRVIRR